MHPPMIDVKDLRKAYNSKRPVLDGVSFEVHNREFVVIHGKSGCGKTTLLNIIGGLDRPTSGDVLIDGTNITGLSENDIAELRLHKIGFVFQDYNLLPDLTVRENVALPLRFSRKRDSLHVDTLLDKFNIADVSNEQASRISGGEAQRTAIARAMINRPVIILADEPTGNLDEENTENVISMFRLVREEFDTTIVLATHDVDLTRHVSKRVFIEAGEATVERTNA